MRVLLIDDHALFRIGLRELLERRGIEVVAAVGDCDDGMELVDTLTPDVVLLDMRMPQMSGIDVLQKMRQSHPQMRIAMLTTSQDESDVLASFQHGADGYLLKDMEPDELIDSLGQILDGVTVVSRELTGILARAAVQKEDEPEPESEPGGDLFGDLTPREREILCHLAEGQSNKVIARHLGISDGTVKLHVKAILRKLDVHSRVEAAVMAVEAGFCHRNS
ncbi:response regulator [Solemya elarraichensis gill symbiont]|uniref:Two-component system response regulator NarL n=1 Tax=Solemya elarraichensis gill symbiont TaxID=1918949 RepID=A0A1T2L8T4_9GAMM|nr:response regulator transcription factor [Solemya elarraichensis gill symbiont]OOZ41517.1 two-component system response regulator NarL [Solemya elarraichensis gill symbiont]